jgi:hypothetical protein
MFMQRQDSVRAYTRRPRRHVDRHAISAVSHLLVVGVWLERQLTNSLWEDIGFPRRRTQKQIVVHRIQTNNMLTETGEEKP